MVREYMVLESMVWVLESMVWATIGSCASPEFHKSFIEMKYSCMQAPRRHALYSYAYAIV